MRGSIKYALFAASFMAAASLAACGTGTAEEQTSSQEITQTAADVSEWRNGKSYLEYRVNDKNGERSLWVDFGAEEASVYENNGQELAVLSYGELADPEYSKAGLTFADTDGDGYVDISMPYVKNEFGSYTYHWIYDFIGKKFMDKTSELTNEKEVLWLIANGMLGNNSSRQITQIYNNADIGVVNGSITLGGKTCKAYSVYDSGSEAARLYFDQDGGWYIDEDCRNIFSVISSVDGAYIRNGVCADGRAKTIAAYTLSDFYADASGVAQGISELWTAAGDAAVSADTIRSTINSVVSAYEIVIDDQGTIRRMPGGTNVFDMAAGQLGISLDKYSELKQ